MSTNIKLIIILCLIFVTSTFPSCKIEDTNHNNLYFFAGHIYDWNHRDRVDPRIEKLNLDLYDQIWLGGDICGHTTENKKTLNYLDSILNVSSSNVQWTLGNHDVMHGNIEWIEKTTGRKSYYTHQIEDLCILVLNTNLFFVYPDVPPKRNCEEKEAQLSFVNQVLDTISVSSHLIILHHFGMFNELQLEKQNTTIKAFNINPDTIKINCNPHINLTDWLYPQLVKIQNKGIQVITIGGDMGMASKSHEYKTSDGIIILGAGLNGSLNTANGVTPKYITNFDPDEVIIFKHDKQKRKLTWDFVSLDSLITNQHKQG